MASLDKLPSVLGLSGLTMKDTYPRGEDGNRTDLTEDMDLRIEDATGEEDFYSDTPLDAKRTSTNGLEDATTLTTNSYDSFEPELIARAGTSTTLESNGGSSSRHALSPTASNLTYASTSSLSLHEHDKENGSSVRYPLTSVPMANTDSHSSILDPVTYQTLKRKNSEADARRVERERQDRSRQLDLLDRLQEQAEHPHLRHVDLQSSGQINGTTETRPRSPLVPQREAKVAAIGLGSPPNQAGLSNGTSDSKPVAVTPEVKKS